MPRDGSGGYLPPQNSWNPAINGAQALPNDWMAILNDIATALQGSLAADGQTPISGVLNFQNNRISQVGAPIGAGDVLRWEQLTKGPDIASAATIAIPVEGMLFDVTGSTTITSIDDRYPGRLCVLRFMDALQLTHSSALQLPDGANLTVQSGDVGIFQNVASGVWRCISWPNRVYTRNNIVGTASQSGGVPTGAIIQRGFNATLGSFVRWADGTQMCWIRRSEANETNSNVVAAGSLFFKMVRNWGFPAAFSSIPSVKVSCPRAAGSPIRMIGQEGEISSSQCEIGFLITSNTSGLSVIYDCFAVGRWYD